MCQYIHKEHVYITVYGVLKLNITNEAIKEITLTCKILTIKESSDEYEGEGGLQLIQVKGESSESTK